MCSSDLVLDDGMKGIQTGFIAQELEKILPSMVVTANDSLGSKAVKYNELFPVLVNAIKEQQAIIERLEVQSETQQRQISALETTITGRMEVLEEFIKTSER